MADDSTAVRAWRVDGFGHERVEDASIADDACLVLLQYSKTSPELFVWAGPKAPQDTQKHAQLLAKKLGSKQGLPPSLTPAVEVAGSESAGYKRLLSLLAGVPEAPPPPPTSAPVPAPGSEPTTETAAEPATEPAVESAAEPPLEAPVDPSPERAEPSVSGEDEETGGTVKPQAEESEAVETATEATATPAKASAAAASDTNGTPEAVRPTPVPSATSQKKKKKKSKGGKSSTGDPAPVQPAATEVPTAEKPAAAQEPAAAEKTAPAQKPAAEEPTVGAAGAPPAEGATEGPDGQTTTPSPDASPTKGAPLVPAPKVATPPPTTPEPDEPPATNEGSAQGSEAPLDRTESLDGAKLEEAAAADKATSSAMPVAAASPAASASLPTEASGPAGLIAPGAAGAASRGPEAGLRWKRSVDGKLEDPQRTTSGSYGAAAAAPLSRTTSASSQPVTPGASGPRKLPGKVATPLAFIGARGDPPPPVPKPVPVAVAPAPTPVAEVTVPAGSKTFPLDELKALRAESGIDMTRKEDYLSQDDFAKAFGKSRAEFDAQPVWRKVLQKKTVGIW